MPNTRVISLDRYWRYKSRTLCALKQIGSISCYSAWQRTWDPKMGKTKLHKEIPTLKGKQKNKNSSLGGRRVKVSPQVWGGCGAGVWRSHWIWTVRIKVQQKTCLSSACRWLCVVICGSGGWRRGQFASRRGWEKPQTPRTLWTSALLLLWLLSPRRIWREMGQMQCKN